MSTASETGHSYGETGPSELDLRRDELTARLRAARAALSPKAAVAAAVSSGDAAEAAALQLSVDQAARTAEAAPARFQPRSMTMKLILERPDITLRVLVAIATLLFGARLAAQFGSAAALLRTLKLTLDGVVTSPPQP
jgi:hypothetical protein